MNQAATTSAPAIGPGTCDPDEFQLPMTGLYADLEVGAGSLRLPEDFLEQSALAQLKVLGDWQRALTRYRRSALRQLARELASGAPELRTPERGRLLRTTCESLRIDLPSDFASLVETT